MFLHKYLFAVPLTNEYADTVARKTVKVFFQHSYIPQTKLSDLGTNFTSKLMSELASLLEVKLKHVSLKHPQINIRFYRKVMDAVAVNSDFVNELEDAMMQKFGENKEKLKTA